MRIHGLRCRVPGCKAIITGVTGLDEIMKLRQHFKRSHLSELTPSEALELRVKWEGKKREEKPCP